jgi:hypothetical protein
LFLLFFFREGGFVLVFNVLFPCEGFLFFIDIYIYMKIYIYTYIHVSISVHMYT